MLTSVRSLLAASLLAGAAFAATPAMAQDEDPFVTVSGNVTAVTDYRFRGVGLSGGDPAVQGGITLSTQPGFYVGVWASSLARGDTSVPLDDGTGDVLDYDVGTFGAIELDFSAGWAGEITPGLGVDVGATYYTYPNAINRNAEIDFVTPSLSGYPIFDGYSAYDTDLIEFYGKVSPSVGPVGLTFGVFYAPKQDSLGGSDNLYLSADASIDIPETPLTLTGHVGYTDGFLTYTADGNAWDYSVGASVTVLGGLSLGVAYVGVEGPDIDGVTDDTVVGTLSFSF